jgi:hypothetical protein
MTGENPKQKLTLLRERNAELERRRDKLRELCQNLDENIRNIQVMYEAMVTSQENQCIDMVAFDEEIKTLTKELFARPVKPLAVRSREENAKMLMQEIMALQRLDAAGCEERLHTLDPLAKQAAVDTRRMVAFIRKYTTFLAT